MGRHTRRIFWSTRGRWIVSVLPTACAPQESSRKPRPCTNWRMASRLEYEYGFARVALIGQETVVQIIFGPDDAEPILGVVALENMGVTVDPITRNPAQTARQTAEASRLTGEPAARFLAPGLTVLPGPRISRHGAGAIRRARQRPATPRAGWNVIARCRHRGTDQRVRPTDRDVGCRLEVAAGSPALAPARPILSGRAAVRADARPARFSMPSPPPSARRQLDLHAVRPVHGIR